MQTIAIVIIDDHPLFRQGIADALSLESDLIIVGEAADGEQGLKLIRQFQPMVAIVDVNLPGMNGHQVVSQVIAEHLPTSIILLTAYDDTEQKIHSIQSGAAAYCTKDVKPEQLVGVIKAVAEGKYVINNEVLNNEEIDHWLIETNNLRAGFYRSSTNTFQPLSVREMEVLVSVTRGMSNKEIAVHLGISHQTVKNHVTSILRKLSVEDRTQAALYALRQGWVRLH